MSSTNDVFDRIAAHYDSLLAEHGPGARACDYGDSRSPAVRYEVLAEIMPLAGLSVLDVGCGLAQFPDLCGMRHEQFRYTGVDISGAMIEEARRIHPGRDIRHANILDGHLGLFDVVIASGIFYLLGAEAQELMPRMIERMWEHARLGVAFNSLSAWAADKDPSEFHADPLEALLSCRRLAERVVLRHDYHPRDFTIYMYREAPPGPWGSTAPSNLPPTGGATA